MAKDNDSDEVSDRLAAHAAFCYLRLKRRPLTAFGYGLQDLWMDSEDSDEPVVKKKVPLIQLPSDSLIHVHFAGRRAQPHSTKSQNCPSQPSFQYCISTCLPHLLRWVFSASMQKTPCQ
jgi:hypothetical protein